jgi:hypothetical protein
VSAPFAVCVGVASGTLRCGVGVDLAAECGTMVGLVTTILVQEQFCPLVLESEL